VLSFRLPCVQSICYNILIKKSSIKFLDLPNPVRHSSRNVVESSLTSAFVDVSLGPDSVLVGDLIQSFHWVCLIESQLLVLDLAPLSAEFLSWLAVWSELWVRVGSTVGQGGVVEAAVSSAISRKHIGDHSVDSVGPS
jgi:hypothetical protein